MCLAGKLELFKTRLMTIRPIHSEIKKKLKEKTSAKKVALDYFDFFYGSSYGDEWKKARLAMLTGHKSVALLNNYAPRSDQLETVKNLERLAAFNVISFISGKQASDVSGLIDANNLEIYSFDNGDVRDFPAPRLLAEPIKLFDYYCMDGASILPVIALQVRLDDVVLDLCASPGGKSVAILQTKRPKLIVCRDNSKSRLDRLERNLKSHVTKDLFDSRVRIEFNNPSCREAVFDRVLVDAPCTNDRKSLNSDENNIFSKSRSDERASMAAKQAELLTQGVLSCKPNGAVVYSTCTLSPIQNEGVVNTVLKTFENESEFSLKVEPLDDMKRYFSYLFDFSLTTKLGLTVVPSIQKNFGPFYLCKINKQPK